VCVAACSWEMEVGKECERGLEEERSIVTVESKKKQKACFFPLIEGWVLAIIFFRPIAFGGPSQLSCLYASRTRLYLFIFE